MEYEKSNELRALEDWLSQMALPPELRHLNLLLGHVLRDFDARLWRLEEGLADIDPAWAGNG